MTVDLGYRGTRTISIDGMLTLLKRERKADVGAHVLSWCKCSDNLL